MLRLPTPGAIGALVVALVVVGMLVLLWPSAAR